MMLFLAAVASLLPLLRTLMIVGSNESHICFKLLSKEPSVET